MPGVRKGKVHASITLQKIPGIGYGSGLYFVNTIYLIIHIQQTTNTFTRRRVSIAAKRFIFIEFLKVCGKDFMFGQMHWRIIFGEAFKNDKYPLSASHQTCLLWQQFCAIFRVYLFIAGPQRVDDESGKAREYLSGKHFITDLSARMIHQWSFQRRVFRKRSGTND